MVAGHRTPYVMVLDLDGRPTPQYTLPDYGHDLTHFILNWLGYSEAYINVHHLPDTITAWVSFVTMLFMLAHPRRFLILRRTTIIFAILFLFRAFTVTVTSLPDASPVCRAQFLNGAGYKREPIFPRSFARAFKFMLSPTTVRSLCVGSRGRSGDSNSFSKRPHKPQPNPHRRSRAATPSSRATRRS